MGKYGKNIGVEINGKNDNFERPVLVIKRYNSEACLVVPLSSKTKTGSYYYSFVTQGGLGGVANISQMRMLSVKRFISKIEKISEKDFLEIKEMIKRNI